MNYEMDSGRLAEVLDEYVGYSHDIKLGEVYGTMLLGEFVWMLARIEDLEAENELLREAISDASHKLESCRIWGGMDWRWLPIHAKTAHDTLRKALEKSE